MAQLRSDKLSNTSVDVPVNASNCVSEALALWSAGEFDRCIKWLDTLGLSEHTSETVFLRARSLLRLQRAQDAKHWLRMNESRHEGERDALATSAMLLGTAYSRLGDLTRSIALFEQSRALAPHPTVIAETDYYHALALWQSREYDAARPIVSRAILSRHDIVGARARQLLGFIAIAQGNFVEAHRHFYAALDELNRCTAEDRHLKAALLHAIAIGEAEVEAADPTTLDMRAHAMDWTSSLAVERAQTLRHIGVAYARSHMPARAILRFIEVAAIQADSPWTVMGFAEAADVCRNAGEPVGAMGYLEIARKTADTLDWSAVQGEARMVLLLLATVVARFGNGADARRYLDLYGSAGDCGLQLPALSALHLDTRLRNFEMHAQALVHLALGKPEAKAKLVAVEQEWRRIGYFYRAAEAANDANLFACGPVAPRSAIVDVKLSPQQGRIVRGLVARQTIKQIAASLGISPKTVQNNLTSLYEIFDVRSQAGLVATVLTDQQLRRRFVDEDQPTTRATDRGKKSVTSIRAQAEPAQRTSHRVPAVAS